MSHISKEESKILSNPRPPKDRFNLVYFTFFICGLGGLIPWNFFITAERYFEYKMRNTSLPEDVDYTKPEYATAAQVAFVSYIAVCSMVPYAITTIANLFIMKWISCFKRFIIGSSLIFFMFLITVILVRIETSRHAFLIITLCSVVIINIGSALLQGSIFGIAAVLPTRNIKATLEGQAISGVLSSLAAIMSIAASSNPSKSALAYFIIALGFTVMSTICFAMLPRSNYFIYYWKRGVKRPIEENETSLDYDETSDRPLPEPEVTNSRLGFFTSMKEVKLPGLCVLLSLLVTLSIFPAVLGRIRPMHVIESDPWTNIFFVPVIVFLSFNVCDWVGRTVAGFIKWPRRNKMWIVLVLTLIRLVFIPLSLLSNVQPHVYLPVVFGHDVFPTLIVVMLGLSNGYLMTVSMMHGPSFASRGNSERAGVALNIYVAIGLSMGVAISAGFIRAL